MATGDTIIGVFERERLSDALTAIHRAGLGVNARVLDRARGDLAGQLARAGVVGEVPLGVDAALLLVVFAPGRLATAVELMQRAGARAVRIASRAALSGVPVPPGVALPGGIGGAALPPARRAGSRRGAGIGGAAPGADDGAGGER